MSLIKCPECKKEISNLSKRCHNCGTYIEIEKENNPKELTFNEKKYIISIIFMILMYLLYCKLPIIDTYTYGYVSFTKLLSYIIGLEPSFIFDLIIIISLLILSIFTGLKNKVLNILSIIGYFLVLFANLIVSVVFILASNFDSKIFVLTSILTLALIIYLLKNFSTSSKKKVVIEVPEETNEKPVFKADELMKLKQLLDDKAITKEEYQKLKDELIK